MNTESGGGTTLGEWLTLRRTTLRMTKAEAARRAGVGRMTWSEWEAGRRLPYDANYAGIEEAMQWTRGSVEAAVLRGEPPVALPPGSGSERAPTADERDAGFDKEREFFRQVLLNLDRQGVPRPLILQWANDVAAELGRRATERKTDSDEQGAAS